MHEPELELICFTDPYCSWCWATEPVLYRLRETYRDQIALRYVMGGLVRDMADFFDNGNGIRTTAQVAPHWREVSQRTGQPIDERLMEDISDPHFSTWPACIAAKAAQLQSDVVGDAYLRRIRRAALTERKLISDRLVYSALAEETRGLDVAAFHKALADGSAKRAFEEDLAECAQYGATGFPTILLRAGDQDQLANGYRPFEAYQQAIRELAGPMTDHAPRQIEPLLADFGPMTTRELAEVYGRSAQEQRAELEQLRAAARVRRLPVRSGELWAIGQSPSSSPSS